MPRSLIRAALVLGVVLIVVIAGLYVMTGRTSASPAQPIPFSHKNHAVDRQIDCNYCHRDARVGWEAMLPPVETCMGCHSSVGLDKPGVQTLRGYAERGEEIQWARLWFVPQHVQFAHSPHVTAAGVQCTECHAQGNPPERWFQPFRPGMSWCLTCHSGRGGGTDCWTCHK
ncbi:MAG: cytochrome c3 family protein [Chloroflexota bacterium]